MAEWIDILDRANHTGETPEAGIADNAITNAKIADNAVDTAEIADNAVSDAKLADMAANTVKANATSGSTDPANLPVGTNTVVGRAAGDIVAAQVVTAQIADDAVSLDKMAAGTAGNLITYDGAGDPAAVATGVAGQVLTSGGAGVAPTFQSAAGLPEYKSPVRAATIVAGTLSTDFENEDTIDGVALATNDRILIKDQATATENGIYIVQASGAPSRASDFASASSQASALIPVQEGTVNADSFWLVSNNAGSDVVDTDNITIVQTPISGVIDAGQITSGTFDDARIAESNVTQHEGALDHNGLLNSFPEEHYPILNSTQVSRPAANLHPNKMHLSTDTSVLVHSRSDVWNSVTTTTADADALNSATTTVNVSAATAPSANQVLRATSSTAATWQTISLNGSGVPGVSTGNGQPLGTIYVDETNDNAYTLVDATTNFNVWSSGSGGIDTPGTTTDRGIPTWDDVDGGGLRENADAVVTSTGGLQLGTGVTNNSASSMVCGRAISSGVLNTVIGADGAAVFGFATGSGSKVEAQGAGDGSLAWGYCTGGGQVITSHNGAFAGGYAGGGDITASQQGAGAHGYALISGSDILANAPGAHAFGASVTADLTASGNGSLAVGWATTNPIEATVQNSFQFAVGSNNEQDCLQVGDTTNGVRLVAGGAPTAITTANGSIWVDGSGDVNISSSGGGVTTPVIFNYPDITGSRGGNAALANLLTALAAMNLITDSTT